MCPQLEGEYETRCICCREGLWNRGSSNNRRGQIQGQSGTQSKEPPLMGFLTWMPMTRSSPDWIFTFLSHRRVPVTQDKYRAAPLRKWSHQTWTYAVEIGETPKSEQTQHAAFMTARLLPQSPSGFRTRSVRVRMLNCSTHSTHTHCLASPPPAILTQPHTAAHSFAGDQTRYSSTTSSSQVTRFPTSSCATSKFSKS